MNNLQLNIEGKENTAPIGAICLNNESIKKNIDKSLNSIKKKLCQSLHEQSKSELERISEKIGNQLRQIEQPDEAIKDLVNVMREISTVREEEYSMRLELVPVRKMYELIDEYKQELEIEYNAAELEKRIDLEKS